MFISSVIYSGELENERRYVKDYYTKNLHNITVSLFDKMPSEPIWQHDIYDNVAKHDIFCLLLAKEITPVVETEFEAAEILGMQKFIFIKQTTKSIYLKRFIKEKIQPIPWYFYYRNQDELAERLSLTIPILESWSEVFNIVASRSRNLLDEIIKELSNTPDLIYKLSWRKFEEIIAKLLEVFGYEVILTPATRDRGKDIIAIDKKGPTIKDKYFIQTKLWKPPRKINEPVISALYGHGIVEDANGVIVIATTYFTKYAIDYALKAKAKNYIELKLYNKNDLPNFYEKYLKLRKLKK